MGRRPRAFIASDSPSTGDLIAEVARSQGYRVVRTRNGLPLLEHLKKQPGGDDPDDVIIIDLSQEAWIGLCLIKVLVHELCTSRVVVVTDGNRQMEPRLRALGVRFVVADPQDGPALRAALERPEHNGRRARPMASVIPAAASPTADEEAG